MSMAAVHLMCDLFRGGGDNDLKVAEVHSKSDEVGGGG